MFRRLRFAFTYAARNLVRNRQRTLFALMSIAAGVATVVALRALGLMLTDALTANAQSFLRGDIRLNTRGNEVRITLLGGQRDPAFSPEVIRQMDRWAAQHSVEITYTLSSELLQLSVMDAEGNGGRPAFAMGTFLDPTKYPFYDVIRPDAPAGASLDSLLAAPNTLVIGQRLASQLGAKVGDQVRLSLNDALHTITGILPDSAESLFNNPNTFFFSFIFINRSHMAAYETQPGWADYAYLKVPAGTNISRFAAQMRQDIPAAANRRNWNIVTAEEVLRNNALAADLISRFVLLCSLVGLVIGGVGIINTMLVSVNRRSGEIATLKTLGLKGRGVTLIFFVEALLLGVVGSFLGVIIGNLLSILARDFGQQAVGVPLPWRFYLDPVLMGMVLGVTITLFFSILPTLMAGGIRPAYVLRQGTIPMARAGCLPSLLSVVILIVGLGALVDAILGADLRAMFWRGGNFAADTIGGGGRSRSFLETLQRSLSIGVFGTFIIFLILGIVVAIMWLFVWLLGKLPSLRNPNMRIALRGLTQHRIRTALSLTALVIGMTALSGTLIMARSITVLLYTSLSDPIGGNVVILPLLPIEGIVNTRLESLAGVNGYRNIRFPASVRLAAINGNTNWENTLVPNEDDPQTFEAFFAALGWELPIGVRVYGSPKRSGLVEGRYLMPEDAGKDVIVVPYSPSLDVLGVKVGSTFTYRIEGVRRDFTIVGILQPTAADSLIPFSLGDSAVQMPLESMPKALPFDLIVADVQPDKVNDVLAGAVLPGVFVFDVGIFDSIISRILNSMAAIPLLVALLSLFAAAALIASTVSLATMERRRQIGILKAVGVKRQQALGQLLIENGIVGAAGGIISLLPTLLILAVVPTLTNGLVRLPVPWELIALMFLTAVAVTLGATLLTAWGASSEHPLRVLRYE
ncbi:MAG TPA: ABC transporter permease [Aggregatilineales bacterium]|nr:ABC transporter permease [Anaerolineales bacterium]HRE47280.1 ABC transporter permease [Aggregatilineales bacterium]